MYMNVHVFAYVGSHNHASIYAHIQAYIYTSRTCTFASLENGLHKMMRPYSMHIYKSCKDLIPMSSSAPQPSILIPSYPYRAIASTSPLYIAAVAFFSWQPPHKLAYHDMVRPSECAFAVMLAIEGKRCSFTTGAPLVSWYEYGDP